MGAFDRLTVEPFDRLKNMAKIERFEDLEVWKAARALSGKIYALTRQKPFRQDEGFCGQIRRAAVSIVSNIAEGFERRSGNQFLHFLDIASGSAGEVRAQLYIALDVGYLDNSQFQDALETVTRITQMLTKLMQYLRTVPNHPPNGQTVKRSNCSTLSRSNESTVPRPNAPTVKRSNGQTVKRELAP